MKANDELTGVPEGTLCDVLAPIAGALQKTLEVEAHLDCRERAEAELPTWCWKIVERFKKTILKPVLRLKPNGGMDWRKYGAMIGVIERCETFFANDVWRIIQEEGLGDLTEEQWERIRPLIGEGQLRQRLIAILGRPVAADEPLEKLTDEALERWFEWTERLKSNARWLVAQQDAKATTQFFKGMAEGYGCFLDENGRYVGDRGRTSLYMDLLAYRLEIDKYRRTMPIKSRRDLQGWLINKAKICIPNDEGWFDHFCDEICLSIKGVGRKPNPQTF